MSDAQLSLLDGPARRDRGVAQAARASEGWVARARAEAVRVARERGEVHVDDIRDWAERTGDRPESSRAWGAVFSRRAHPWKAIGVRASRHPSNHAHASPVWVLEEPRP